MIYPKIPLAQSIIEIFLAKGITNIIISPGSRNAPLTIGFASNPAFQCYSIADERSAGFFALGIAQQIKKPVVLVCTSGSALLNYYPAFAEAFYSQIPLIVLSADRPQHKIDIGDGQTIRQENVFANHSAYNANLDEYATLETDRQICNAIDTAVSELAPVHINAPFEEPLYDTVSELSRKPIVSFLAKEKSVQPIDDLKPFAEIWNKATRKMILIGVNNPNEIDDTIIQRLAKDSSVVVLTETTSNVHHPSFVSHIDTLITSFTAKDFENLQPEVLLTFGGMVISKRIKVFLRKYKPNHHWHIDERRAYDTYESLTKHFATSPNNFFNQFLPLTKDVASNYFETTNAIVQDRKAKHKIYVANVPFSDFKFFHMALPKLPKNSQLHISNSSAIRYAQLFPIDPTIEIFCNRGTSGIDGATSTAIGASVANGKQTLFITGDISFLYDSNALWNNYIPKDFKIIVLNNRGGGIFRILPGHQENEVFTTFFETSHHYDAAPLAKMYGLEYLSADDENSLEKGLTELFSKNDKPMILEVFTPTKINDTVLERYFKQF